MKKTAVLSGIIAIFSLLVFSSCNLAALTTDDVFTVRADDWVLGPSSARVTIIQYSDFQCLACKVSYPALKRTGRDFPDDVRIIFRHFPLNQHQLAFPAAQATEAAGAQGKFWEMHDLLFDKQEEWSSSKNPRNDFESYAKELNLDLDRFKSDFVSDTTVEKINRYQNDQKILHMLGTPSTFINGSPAPSGQYEKLKEAVSRAILESKSQTG